MVLFGLVSIVGRNNVASGLVISGEIFKSRWRQKRGFQLQFRLLSEGADFEPRMSDSAFAGTADGDHVVVSIVGVFEGDLLVD